MNDHFDSQEAANIWRSQATEGVTFPVDEIRRRIERWKARARLQRIVGRWTAVVNLLVICAVGLFYENPFTVWLRVASLVLWFVWGMQLTGAGSWMLAFPPKLFLTLELDATPQPCLEFYRIYVKELERRHNSIRIGLRATPVWGLLGPVFVLVASRVKNPSAAIFLGATLMVFAIVWYIHLKREYPRIQREIDELKNPAAS
jgi:hypothetical protein